MTTFTSDAIEQESTGSGLMGFSDLLLSVALVAVVMLAVNLLVLSTPRDRIGAASGIAARSAGTARPQPLQATQAVQVMQASR